MLNSASPLAQVVCPKPRFSSSSSTLLAIMASGPDFDALLRLTKPQCRIDHPSPEGLTYHKTIVGAVIFHPAPSPPAKILLLKRTAIDEFYPNVFEIPGGHVEDTDADIFGALVREVQEETSLSVDSVKGSIESFTYSTKKTMKVGEKEVEVQKSSLQLNFVCEVAEDTFRVKPEEPSEGIWAAEDEVGSLEMTEGMRLVVEDAFRWKAEQAA